MNPKYHLLAAVAALGMYACTTDDTCTEPENEGYKLSFTVAENSETRTTLDKDDGGIDILKWVSADDKVGVYTVGKNENPNTLTVADVNQHPVEFIGVLEKLVSPGDMFYAYYPYDVAQSTDPAAVKLSIPAEQTQTKAGVYNGQSHPLVSLPMAFPWEQDSYACRISSVRFRQLGAIVELQLFSSNEALRSEKIHSVAFVSDTPLAGDFTFNLTTVTDKEEPQISGYESKEVTTSLEVPAAIPATKEGAALVYLTIAPGQYAGKIVVTTDEARYTFRLKNTMNFERAVIKGLPADLAKVKREIYSDAFIPFEDPEVKRICVENWDTNGDGELSYKEAVAVTSIGSQFQSPSIGSFNELQYFTGLQSIGQSAFSGCSSLTSINIPDGVTEIGAYAFRACSRLKGITIPDGVTTIGEYAFSFCSELTNINIPQTVSSIGEGAFGGDSSLSAFEGKFASADHRCLILDGKLLAFAPADLTEYTIPDEVTAIGGDAFWGCSKLTSIHIPEGVTAIGNRTFSYCSSLTSVTIPNRVTTIGIHAFEGCSSLTSVYCKPTTPPALGYKAFSDTPSNMEIYVPTASVGTYQTAGDWSEYASQIVADNN